MKRILSILLASFQKSLRKGRASAPRSSRPIHLALEQLEDRLVPTGLVVTCQDEKSQHKNKAKALKVLRTRLFEMERERLASERAGARKSMVGSGDRSERIRTYNFPQGRVTDHRINLTLHKLDEILEGPGLTEIIDALVAEDEADRLAGLEEA